MTALVRLAYVLNDETVGAKIVVGTYVALDASLVGTNGLGTTGAFI